MCHWSYSLVYTMRCILCSLRFHLSYCRFFFVSTFGLFYYTLYSGLGRFLAHLLWFLFDQYADEFDGLGNPSLLYNNEIDWRAHRLFIINDENEVTCVCLILCVRERDSIKWKRGRHTKEENEWNSFIIGSESKQHRSDIKWKKG